MAKTYKGHIKNWTKIPVDGGLGFAIGGTFPDGAVGKTSHVVSIESISDERFDVITKNSVYTLDGVEVVSKAQSIWITGLDEFRAEPVDAYRGAGDNVYVTPEKAIDSKVSNGLAGEWLKGRGAGDRLNIPFNEIVNDATERLELYEKIIVFARWRRTNGIGTRRS